MAPPFLHKNSIERQLSPIKKSSVCYGDSGGPAVVRAIPDTPNSEYRLAGVLSCMTSMYCLRGNESIFTPVSDHAAWVKRITDAP